MNIAEGTQKASEKLIAEQNSSSSEPDPSGKPANSSPNSGMERDLSKSQLEPMSKLRIPFQDRAFELETLVNNLTDPEGNHFWSVTAGPQMGKTWLLEKLKETLSYHRSEPWVIKLLDLGTQPADFRSDAKRLLGVFFGVEFKEDNEEESLIQAAENISISGHPWLCLLDSAEMLDEIASSDMRRYLSQIYHHLQGINGRLAFVAASRCPHRAWKGVFPNPRFNQLTLTHFNPSVIKNTLLEVVKQEISYLAFDSKWYQEIAERLYRVTEGIPALLTVYINWIQETRFTILERIEDQKRFDQLARPYVQEVLLSDHVLTPSGGDRLAERKSILESALLKLSPYRCLTLSHLKHICEEDANFKGSLDTLGWTMDDFWDAIQNTHLIEPKQVIWSEVYRPIRRLLFRYQFPSEPEQAEAHLLAAKFYDDWWAYDMAGDLQSTLVWEYLWHYAKYLPKTTEGKQEFVDVAEALFERIFTKHQTGVKGLMDYLEERLLEDDEIQEALQKHDEDMVTTLISIISQTRKRGRV